DEGIVGASLALVVDGKAERHEVHGFADLGERRPVDDRTIYHWASITKTLTAISIMQLRDRGLLSLDDPIVDHVPELRDVYNPFGRMEDVTIRQIMSHSAGFRAGTWPWGGDEEWHPHEPTEWSQLVAMIPYTRIHFPPGSRFSYSNPGIIFLGRVIEKLTGDVFETYVDKNVFRPLGMRNAYFDGTPRHLLAHRSNHYFVEEGTSPRAGGPDFDTGITVSNGGLNAPVTDMVRYLGFLMGSPPDDIPDGWSADAVLSRASLEEMWRTVVPIQDTGIGRETMGLSFFLYDNGGTRIVGHTGTQRAFYSFMAFDPVARVGAVGAFNTAGTSGSGPDTHAIRIGTRDAVVNQVFPLVRGGAR
ncbi:MAG: beta-lactamase family protein, partial [Gemmatimonadota bacterium]|nr:beta-lactamase family protein [Gemmatimonadota bacterium]